MANRRIANFPTIPTLHYKLSTTGVEPGLRWCFLTFLKAKVHLNIVHAYKYLFRLILGSKRRSNEKLDFLPKMPGDGT